MTINPKQTIREILLLNNALFSIGTLRITETIKKRPAPEYICMHRKFPHRNRIFPARNVADITIGELDILNKRLPDEDYFVNVLSVMLGIGCTEKRLPDGRPDWPSGWKADKDAVFQLGFIDAFRYFIEVQNGLKNISNAWSKLGKWKPEKGSKRPNRGMVSVCREYSKMVGGTSPTDVWLLPWPIVYEAFENTDFENKEQYENFKRMKINSRPSRTISKR